MITASYRKGVEWIALNDDAGSDSATSVIAVRSYISVMLLADLFGVEVDKVARAVVRYRRTHGAGE
jgi:hypothetical protein